MASRSTKTPAATATLPKPRVTPKAPDYFKVDFGNGATGQITKGESYDAWSDEWHWFVRMPDGSQRNGRALGQNRAFEAAWQAAAKASVPAPVFTAEEVAQLAEQAESGDRTAATKIMRKVLKARTGLEWSVTGNRGTAYGWLRISAPPKRCVGKFDDMTAHDAALLAAVLGEDYVSPNNGVSVRPCSGVRAATVYRLAGHPIPDALHIAAPSWD